MSATGVRAEVARGADLHRQDRQTQRSGVGQLGQARLGGQGVAGQEEQEHVALTDPAQDVLPPGVATPELLVVPHRQVSPLEV